MSQQWKLLILWYSNQNPWLAYFMIRSDPNWPTNEQ